MPCASRNACLVAAAFAEAGITAIITDTIIDEGFCSLTEVLGGRSINFVVLRPSVAVLRKRGVERLPEEAVYLERRYSDAGHPEAAQYAARLQSAADGRPVNDFEEAIEWGLDRLPRVSVGAAAKLEAAVIGAFAEEKEVVLLSAASR